MFRAMRTALRRLLGPHDPAVLTPVGEAAQDVGDLQFGAFKAERGTCDRKLVLLTIPKAGTYLLAALVEKLGVIDLEIHLSDTLLSDYRGLSLEQKVARARLVTRYIPLDVAARMIQPGQFAVGHIPCTDAARDALAPLARILCVRELRQSLTSLMHFEIKRIAVDPEWMQGCRDWAFAEDDRRRLHGFLSLFAEGYLANAVRIFAWSREPGVLLSRFEHLLGDDGPEIQEAAAEAIARHIGAKSGLGLQALRGVVGRQTLTFSGRRTSLEGVWDEDAEGIFQRLGGRDVNKALGY